MRKIPFVNKEIYHVYNRGVDKRLIFIDYYDLQRFFLSMQEFNTVEPIGSIFENRFKELGSEAPKLVEFLAFSLNPNHYHFQLLQLVEGGISKFMQRMATGYTNYFNEKNKRSGSLFQGPFKAVWVETNEYLLHLNTYINLNYIVHSYDENQLQLCKSSWREYSLGEKGICKKELILEQFETINAYKNYADSSLEIILKKRREEKRYEKLLLE